MLRRRAILTALTMLAFAVAPSPIEAQCVAPEAHALFDAIPASDRDGIVLDSDGVAEPQTRSLELDGAAPAEAVLAIDVLLGDLHGDLHDGPARSLVWVLGCRAGRWTPLGRLRLDIDSSWDGTIDERPGVRVIRPESFRGMAHDLLRIEHIDVRGGYDPRYVRRRFLLVGLVDDRLTVALDAIVRDQTTVGPDREDGFGAIRTLIYDRARPWIRLRIVETSPNGRRRTLCRARLRFDGARFVPDDARCAMR